MKLGFPSPLLTKGPTTARDALRTQMAITTPNVRPNEVISFAIHTPRNVYMAIAYMIQKSIQTRAQNNKKYSPA